jgi:hypothetical protein
MDDVLNISTTLVSQLKPESLLFHPLDRVPPSSKERTQAFNLGALPRFISLYSLNSCSCEAISGFSQILIFQHPVIFSFYSRKDTQEAAPTNGAARVQIISIFLFFHFLGFDICHDFDYTKNVHSYIFEC